MAMRTRGGGVRIEDVEDDLEFAEEAASWADEDEIDSFDRFVRDFRAGRVNPDDFKKFRLQHGVYGQRQQEAQMVRVKIPWGGLTAAQLERVAELADRTPRGVGHVTTRQNVQFHFVPLAEAPEFMRALGEVGLTTREACGNTVRNVTVGHCAGVCPREAFDPTPYADAVARFLLRNPMNQNLPRKFKIAFSGCADDTGLTPIHDVGARAAVRIVDGGAERGFVVLLGGGLGPAPRLAEALEDFTPAADLLPTVAAIVRVFDRHGNRENRNLARLKFVVKKLGIDAVRALVVKERAALRVTIAFPPVTPREEHAPAPRPGHGHAGRAAAGLAYTRWRASNVLLQKQSGYAAVHVRLVRGDATGAELRAVARLARDLGDARIRTSNQQNLILRWIPVDALPAAYAALGDAGLALPGAEGLIDVTSCPGADTCQLGITSSRGLALALSETIERELPDLADAPGLRIKISGCPNSCGQHHIAAIGLYGGARKFNGEQAPTYQLLLGGRVTGALPRYARPVARIPAREVPAAVQALLAVYRDERAEHEAFDAFVDRVGADRLEQVVEPWTELPPPAEAPDKYLDWGADQRFTLETGPGECAA
ncbi:MAG: nitrite/sulfite reductase [Candidatus Rokuibacteriota bacterium]